MQYINISLTNRSNAFFSKYINNNLSNSELKHRGASFGFGCIKFVTSIADTIIGMGLGCGDIVTAGKIESLHKLSVSQLDFSYKILSPSYRNFLKAINPKAHFSDEVNTYDINFQKRNSEINHKPPMISCRGNGLLADSIALSLDNFANRSYQSDNLIKKYVISRLTYPVLALACLVTRLVDGIIGLLAATFSLLTLGKFTLLNNIAVRGLESTGIINDFFYCVIKTINPGAKY